MPDPISISSLIISIISQIRDLFKYLILKIVNHKIKIKIDRSGNISGSTKNIIKKFKKLSRNSRYLNLLEIVFIDDRKELHKYNDLLKELRKNEIQKKENDIKKGVILMLDPKAKEMYQININMAENYIKIIMKFIKLYMKALPYKNEPKTVSIDCMQKNNSIDLFFSLDINENDLISAIKVISKLENPIINEGLIFWSLNIDDIKNNEWLYNDFFPNMLNGVIHHTNDEEFNKLNITKLYCTFDWSIGLH